MCHGQLDAHGGALPSALRKRLHITAELLDQSPDDEEP